MKNLFRSSLVTGLCSIILAVAIWQLIVFWQLVPRSILPAPLDILQLATTELASGRLFENIKISGSRLLVGFFIGGVLGVLIGATLGTYSLARAILFPVFETLRPIPPLAWVPLAMIWFGIGESSKIFLIALTVFFPVFITSMKGVQHLSFELLRAALSLDVRPRQLFFTVTLPAALPDIVTGLRLGWSMGLVALVGAEMIASQSGLGYMIMDGMNRARFDFVILGILTIGVISILTDALFIRFSRSRLLKWHHGLEQNEV